MSIDREFFPTRGHTSLPRVFWLILAIWTLRNIFLTHVFFVRLSVSLQVPGARCPVSENSTSKLDEMNECVGKSIKK